ncbi:MAG: YHS domain-containing protein [Synechococcaceae bacterium WBA_2_066]|nr:YHS domain-containing protein [Synechococcaceae bacterium WB6_1A_059]NBP33584.1 YHS domain-containing protein [Synechococcaceae bacterium WB6_1B_055]NBP98835.1 YHS domain-containing protein [Synechococcaceae bacterium WB6_3A_227]NBQ18301.1 YHS domain-containing protein [Synechococcaceae bacterium WB5_2A_257]NBR43679.1 YHS domain-containing protein [Synechococcaceae bacterium WB5_2B_268]NBY59155.1 YHS domain-containing protein [Synechococcaceae bacterium LLD_019]NCU77243.1 YHS domain-contai
MSDLCTMHTHMAPVAMAKDPICGMVVPTATALSVHRTGRRYYFCDEACRQATARSTSLFTGGNGSS